MAGVEPHAIHGREAGVPQPDDVVQQCGRMIVGIRKAEMVPALVEESLEENRRAERLRLRACQRVPSIGRGRASRRMLRLENVGHEQRAVGREPVGSGLIEILFLRVVEVMQRER